MNRRRATLLLLLAAAGLPLAAAERVRDEPVHLRADRIEIDQKKGVSRYVGRVSLRQGTLRITAARAEARSRGDTLEFVTAQGNPLTFRDLPAGQTQPVEGAARRLEYEAGERRVHLYEEVDIHQGDDRIRGGVVHYDIPNQTVRAESDGRSRVSAALMPRRPAGLEPESQP
jgi:lipopolysaccharide export system protein LptA